MAPTTSNHSSHEWFRAAKHKPRALDKIKSEISRSYERRYIFRRPHPLQYRKDEDQFKANLHDVEHLAPVISDEITPVQSRNAHMEKSRSDEDPVESQEVRLRQARVTEKHRRAQFGEFERDSSYLNNFIQMLMRQQTCFSTWSWYGSRRLNQKCPNSLILGRIHCNPCRNFL